MSRNQIIEQLTKMQERLAFLEENLEPTVQNFAQDELEDMRHDLSELISQLARLQAYALD